MRWQNASYYYRNMSTLITHVNARPETYGLRIRWATPSEYFRALHAATNHSNYSWPLLEGDPFTPYDSNQASAAMKSFWTGIYDSETEEKRWTRRTMNVLRAAHASFALAQAVDPSPKPDASALLPTANAGLGSDASALLRLAGQSVGIGVHHDAIPGTSNTGEYTGSDPIHGGFVVQDYVGRLQNGTALQKHLKKNIKKHVYKPRYKSKKKFTVTPCF